MGLYAEAVQSKGYRDAKIRTLLDAMPAVIGPSGSELDLQWASPDGTVHASAATILAPLRKNSSCPLRFQRGWAPPSVETCDLPPGPGYGTT